MSTGVAFALALAIVAPAWVILILDPGGRAARAVVHNALIFLLLAAFHAVVTVIAAVDPADLSSWDRIQALYRDDVMVLNTWLHFIAVDLFVGAWMARDGTRLGVHGVVVRLCLVVTFSIAPLGIAIYLIVRARTTGTAAISESSPSRVAPGTR